jgi:glycosyltransferase involved in cell wall biosynthesis
LVFSAIVPKLSGAKIILDIHDIVPEFFASKFNYSHRSLLYKLLTLAEKLSTAFSDHVIIANDIWYKKIVSRSVSADKCTAILNYPDDTIFYKRNSKPRNAQKIIFLYPGTLNWHQGLDIAIYALSKVKRLHPNFEFHIYGSGEKKAELKKLANQLGLKSNVLFKNGVPLQELPDVISQADIGIIPKRNDNFGGEAFSTKSLEFMAVGLPVIISETKIDRHYFNDNIVQFFKPGSSDDLAEKIEQLIKNQALRKKLSKNALQFSLDHNWSAKQSLYFNIVNSLIP